MKYFIKLAIIFGLLACWLYFLMQGFYSNYVPADWLNSTLWYGVFPVSTLAIVAVILFKRRQYWELMRPNKQRNKLFAFFAWTRTYVAALTSPLLLALVLVGTLEGIACFITDKISSQPYEDDVVVTRVACEHAKRRSPARTELSFVTSNRHEHSVDFSYAMCQENPGIKNLVGNMIILYGKKGWLGAKVEGFKYPPYINIEES